MDFFDFGFNKVATIITNCWMENVWNALAYGIVGFTLALVIIVFLHRKRFMASKVVYWICLIYGTIGMTTVFAFYSAIKTTEAFLITEIHEDITPMTKASFPAFQLYVTYKWSKIVAEKQSMETVMAKYSEHVKFKEDRKSFKDHMIAVQANCMTPILIDFGVHAVIEVASNRASERYLASMYDPNLGVDKNLQVGKELSTITYKDEFWEEVEAVITEKVHGFADPYYPKIGIYFLIVLLPLLGLIFLSRKEGKDVI